MPAARALLADVKPPISDAAIADSLWHYWFDVEKAVGWLRKDWEKKGESRSESTTSLSSSMSKSTSRQEHEYVASGGFGLGKEKVDHLAGQTG